jgi:hypothetical protein
VTSSVSLGRARDDVGNQSPAGEVVAHLSHGEARSAGLMGEQVAGCWILAAARGDDGSYRKVLEAVRRGLADGSQTIVPCACTPRCPQPTPEQMEALDRRLQSDLSPTPGEADVDEVGTR